MIRGVGRWPSDTDLRGWPGHRLRCPGAEGPSGTLCHPARRARRQDPEVDRPVPAPTGGLMTTYSFRLTLAGVDEVTPEMAEALFEATAHDCTPGSSGGVATVDFDREAGDLADAVGTAIRQ